MEGNYSEKAKVSLSIAVKWAKKLRQSYVGSEHILLGLVLNTESMAGTVLAANKEYLASKGYVVDNPLTKQCFDLYLGEEE